MRRAAPGEFARCREVAVERAERKGPRAMRRNLCGLADLKQLDERGRKLDDAVMCAPRMLVARAYVEAKPPIKIGGGIEVAHGMDDMIEAASHRCDTTPSGCARPLPR